MEHNTINTQTKQNNINNNETICDNTDESNKNCNKKIYFDKLFPKLNNVNIQNLLIDYESISYITTPSESRLVANIIATKISQYKPPKECNIIDATAGVGGDSIMFCTTFGSVISIELDRQKYEYLKHNLDQYNFKNVNVLNGDSIIIIPKLQFVDIIYIDPPWGGKSYKTKENLRLTMGNVFIETFVQTCFNENFTSSPPKIIVLKLPKNYDLKILYETLNDIFDIYLYNLKKINILLIEKKQTLDKN